MSFERNDVVFKNRLAEALEENTMGFEHNDIVTVDKMNKAIAEGGGGGDFTSCEVTLMTGESRFPISLCTVIVGVAVPVTSPEPGKHTVPLYKGNAALIMTDDSSYYTVSGNATIDSDEIILVTGDCEISYEDK